jgi:hypothetical protein
MFTGISVVFQGLAEEMACTTYWNERYGKHGKINAAKVLPETSGSITKQENRITNQETFQQACFIKAKCMYIRYINKYHHLEKIPNMGEF